MNILVTGSNGQLGMEMRKVSACSSDRYIFTDVNDFPGVETEYLDITDSGAVNSLVREKSIGAIVNCAAYTDVDRAEEDILYLQNIDPELHETLLDRIKKEKLTVYYALLASYSSRLGDVAYQAIKSEFTEYCTKFNIVRYREGQTVDSFLETFD